jgi:hypothetical protein
MRPAITSWRLLSWRLFEALSLATVAAAVLVLGFAYAAQAAERIETDQLQILNTHSFVTDAYGARYERTGISFTGGGANGWAPKIDVSEGAGPFQNLTGDRGEKSKEAAKSERETDRSRAGEPARVSDKPLVFPPSHDAERKVQQGKEQTILEGSSPVLMAPTTPSK